MELLRYAVINQEGQPLSNLYIRKGDARREKDRWYNNSDKSIGTFKLVLTKEEN